MFHIRKINILAVLILFFVACMCQRPTRGRAPIVISNNGTPKVFRPSRIRNEYIYNKLDKIPAGKQPSWYLNWKNYRNLMNSKPLPPYQAPLTDYGDNNQSNNEADTDKSMGNIDFYEQLTDIQNEQISGYDEIYEADIPPIDGSTSSGYNKFLKPANKLPFDTKRSKYFNKLYNIEQMPNNKGRNEHINYFQINDGQRKPSDNNKYYQQQIKELGYNIIQTDHENLEKNLYYEDSRNIPRHKHFAKLPNGNIYYYEHGYSEPSKKQRGFKKHNNQANYLSNELVFPEYNDYYQNLYDQLIYSNPSYTRYYPQLYNGPRDKSNLYNKYIKKIYNKKQDQAQVPYSYNPFYQEKYNRMDDNDIRYYVNDVSVDQPNMKSTMNYNDGYLNNLFLNDAELIYK